MMKKSILLFLFVFVLVANAKEHYLRIPFENKTQVQKLIYEASFDEVKNGYVYLYANDGQLEKLGKYNYDICANPSSFFKEKMAYTAEELRDWDSYPTYEAYIELMMQFAQDYPEICTIENIGSSIQGRDILVAKISDNAEENEAEPEVYYSGQIHGDEIVAGVLFMQLIDDLLTNYQTDDEITELIDNTEIFINPISNPDGAYAGGNHTMLNATRSNSNGIDLNRNFPDYFGSQNPDGNETQLENIVQMNFIAEHNFVLSANSHSGTVVINYPYDAISDYHTDDAWFQFISREYADLAQDASNNTYMTEYNDGITNGHEWYEVHGGRQDYVNTFAHCREITLELSQEKILPVNELPVHWNYNRASFYALLQQAQHGIRGFVHDENGNPIEAKIEIINHDENDSFVFCSPLGDFYRPIYEGTYDVFISKSGYVPQLFENVLVGNNNATELDITLQQASEISVAGTVLNENAELISDASVRFIDEEAVEVITDDNGIFEFENLYSGFYSIEVEATGYPMYKSTFTMTTSIQNLVITLDEILFEDGFENGTTNWNLEGDWGTENEGGSSVLSDSPNTSYDDAQNSSATIGNSFNFSSLDNASCGFEISYDLEAGYDFGFFEIKVGNEDWEVLDTFNGNETGIALSYSLQDYLAENILFRFRIQSDGSVNENGMRIDEFYVAAGHAPVENEIIESSQRLRIAQNYPNPFKIGGETSIDVQSSLRGKKTLHVYNIRGQHIFKKEVNESRRKITWDGKMGEKNVSSGVYFYQIEQNNIKSNIKKMLLMK